MKKDIQMQRHSVVPKESSKDKLVIGYKKPTGRQSEKKLTAVNHVRGTMSKSPTRTFASNMKNNIKLQQHPVVPKDKLAIWSKRPTSKQPQKKTTSLNPVKGVRHLNLKAGLTRKIQSTKLHHPFSWTSETSWLNSLSSNSTRLYLVVNFRP
ncbi:hypothetical protein PSTT_05653 [Puccinia striiformis]|uniref:Uncharacterized protein n=2 Tax=Puccinia striiformis TaxID=27350 RepID=A0A0L0VV23_9BASI|nr:hypothetical protein PSTG_03736 [Puccinia striiformis f. sp. tritici PST-78]POW10912.1 hypothetical protein PSTT_05653 [Puccinia striiformis]